MKFAGWDELSAKVECMCAQSSRIQGKVSACVDLLTLPENNWAQGEDIKDFGEPAMGEQEQALLLL